MVDLIVRCLYTKGSPKKHKTWKTTWELLTDILEKIQVPSVKTNM